MCLNGLMQNKRQAPTIANAVKIEREKNIDNKKTTLNMNIEHIV